MGSNIKEILKIVSGAFKLSSKPVAPLPPPLIVLGGNIRPGISAKEIAARIISRQSQAGAPVGDIFDSSNNISEAMELIRIEEIVSAVLTQAKVDVVIPPGVPVTSIGIGNLGVPIVSQGTTSSFGIGTGIIR